MKISDIFDSYKFFDNRIPEPKQEKARLEKEKVEAWKKKEYDLNSFDRKQLKKRGVNICPESDLEFASAFLIISFAISVPFANNSVWFQK